MYEEIRICWPSVLFKDPAFINLVSLLFTVYFRGKHFSVFISPINSTVLVLYFRKIGKDIANTFAKLEKLTIRK